MAIGEHTIGRVREASLDAFVDQPLPHPRQHWISATAATAAVAGGTAHAVSPDAMRRIMFYQHRAGILWTDAIEGLRSPRFREAVKAGHFWLNILQPTMDELRFVTEVCAIDRARAPSSPVLGVRDGPTHTWLVAALRVLCSR